MQKHLLLGFVGALLLSACATTGTDCVNMGYETLAKSATVVFSTGEIRYEQVALNEPIQFEFNEGTTVLQTGESRCFAKGFAIPSGHVPYSVTVTSYGAGTPEDPAIMYPDVKVLDKDYRVVYSVPATDFVLRPSLSQQGLQTVLFVNNKRDESERFLLVTNRTLEEADLTMAHDTIHRSVPVVVPVPGGIIMWMVPAGRSMPPVPMKASATGQVEVLFQEYKPRKVGK